MSEDTDRAVDRAFRAYICAGVVYAIAASAYLGALILHCA
jgi:hypothetical protein